MSALSIRGLNHLRWLMVVLLTINQLSTRPAVHGTLGLKLATPHAYSAPQYRVVSEVQVDQSHAHFTGGGPLLS